MTRGKTPRSGRPASTEKNDRLFRLQLPPAGVMAGLRAGVAKVAAGDMSGMAQIDEAIAVLGAAKRRHRRRGTIKP